MTDSVVKDKTISTKQVKKMKLLSLGKKLRIKSIKKITP